MKWLLCRDSKLSQHRRHILQKVKQPFIIIEVIALQIIVSHLPILVNWYSFQTPTLFQSLNSFSASWPFTWMCCLKNYRHQSELKATCSGYFVIVCMMHMVKRNVCYLLQHTKDKSPPYLVFVIITGSLQLSVNLCFIKEDLNPSASFWHLNLCNRTSRGKQSRLSISRQC